MFLHSFQWNSLACVLIVTECERCMDELNKMGMLLANAHDKLTRMRDLASTLFGLAIEHLETCTPTTAGGLSPDAPTTL